MSDPGDGEPAYVTSDLADQDILDIALHVAQKSSIGAADRLADRFFETFNLLAQSPMMGRSRPELAPLLRSFPVNNYIIFYRVIEYGVAIVRVVHGARDLPPLFGGEPADAE